MGDKGFDTFMSNPHWKRIYDEAPSNELRAYYRIMFNTSPFLMKTKAEVESERRALKDVLLSGTDVKYLRDHAGNSMARSFYSKMLAKLDRLENSDAMRIPAIVICGEERNPWFQERPRQE